MLAELVFSYYLINTEPMYLRTTMCPCADVKVALHVNKEFWDGYSVDIEPYVLRDVVSGQTGRAGAKLRFEKNFGWVTASVFHESIHNLDASYGLPYEMDGVELRWRLSK